MQKIITILLLALLTAVLAFFVFSYIVEYNPEAEVEVTEYHGNVGGNSVATLPDTLRIMTWNIGYAGLGDNMDFFVDGGECVRDSKERTEQNLSDIISKLQEADADIYLLQEVDEKAHRTYSINEIQAISNAFPGYYVYFAPNFKVWFVPSPLREPMGQIKSGLVILSRVEPSAVRRIQYPSSFSFPVRMFNIKRCLLEADFKTAGGKTIHIGNTHNTAFDTGGMRSVEDRFLKERVASFTQEGECFIVAGDWNQCPPQYSPTEEELCNEFFAPEIFDTDGIDNIACILCDTTHYSMRYNDKPYCAASTKSLLDFFLVSRSEGIEPLGLRILDLDFHSSDHNPVVLDVVITI